MSLSFVTRHIPGLKDIPSREDRALTQELDELFEQAKTDRMQYEGQWLVNLAFFKSQQWVTFDTITRRLSPVRLRGKNRVKMVVNRIRQQVLTKYAKLLSTTPQSYAQPASDDVDDRHQAEVCDAVLQYVRTVDGSEGAEARALLWAGIVGTGIFQETWNKTAGTPLLYPKKTFMEMPDEMGQMVKQEVDHPQAGQPVLDDNKEPVHLGEIETQEVSPFEFYPDPFGLTMKDKSWYFTQSLRYTEYVME